MEDVKARHLESWWVVKTSMLNFKRWPRSSYFK